MGSPTKDDVGDTNHYYANQKLAFTWAQNVSLSHTSRILNQRLLPNSPLYFAHRSSERFMQYADTLWADTVWAGSRKNILHFLFCYHSEHRLLLNARNVTGDERNIVANRKKPVGLQAFAASVKIFPTIPTWTGASTPLSQVLAEASLHATHPSHLPALGLDLATSPCLEKDQCSSLFAKKIWKKNMQPQHCHCHQHFRHLH